MRVPFKGIIFDMDGTLLDSNTDWKNAFRKAFADNETGYSETEIEELFTYGDIGIRAFIERKIQRQHPGREGLSQRIAEAMFTDIENRYEKAVRPKKGAPEFVKKAFSMGIKLCVATLTSHDMAERALRRAGIFEYLEFIVGGDEIRSSKDTPEIYLKAAEKLRLRPEEILVFEDSMSAAGIAKSAGFSVCVVADREQRDNPGNGMEPDLRTEGYQEPKVLAAILGR